MIKLYNTLTKQVEEVRQQGPLNMYTCGPTVYNYAHIGNLRSYVVADLLYRALKADGRSVRWVMNITDIDDKTIKSAIAEYGPEATVANLQDYTNRYFEAFINDLREVNVLVDEVRFIRVTDVIPDIQKFIMELVDRGFAYRAEDGSTYFSIEKYQLQFGDYGHLVGEKFLEGKKTGARVKVDEYDKDNLSDFALWKAHQPEDANIYWDHPSLGKGRPGWHIECSVINRVAFGGETTHIHTGGVDLIFPHHTNEIAQSQPLYRPFTCYWFHPEHLLVDGKKMSKSLGNVHTLKDLKEKGFSGQDFRYLLMSAHYRSQQNFTWESLMAAHAARERYHNLTIDTGAKAGEFIAHIENDLNVPAALSAVWDKGEIAPVVDDILAVRSPFEPVPEIPDEVVALMDQRLEARQAKDFAKSDELRDRIAELGYEVMDTAEGQKAKKIIQL